MLTQVRKLTILSIFAIACVLNTSCVYPVRVEGIAMQPTFNEGDRILVRTVINELQLGDVITFRYPADESEYYFKRIIGLPNETIEIRNGAVLVNGQILD